MGHDAIMRTISVRETGQIKNLLSIEFTFSRGTPIPFTDTTKPVAHQPERDSEIEGQEDCLNRDRALES